MAQPSDFEDRLTAVEARLEAVAADALAARHLAAARDRDLADLGLKVDANRSVINALGEQTAARFDRIDQRFDRIEHRVESGFAEVRDGFTAVGDGFADIRARLDQTAAGQAHIAELLDTLIARDDK